MIRWIVVAAVLMLASSVPPRSALAQTSDPRGACKADYDKYCAGTAPGGGRIVACLNKQHDQLTVACKKALDNRKK